MKHLTTETRFAIAFCVTVSAFALALDIATGWRFTNSDVISAGSIIVGIYAAEYTWKCLKSII